MTLISHKRPYPIFGDLGFLDKLYFYYPPSGKGPFFLTLEKVTDYPWDKRLQTLLEKRVIKEKTDYCALHFYNPKYIEPILKREWLTHKDVTKIEVTQLEKLQTVPTGQLIVPKLGNMIGVYKETQSGLVPTIYFTSLEELNKWKNQASPSLFLFPTQKS